MSFLHFQAAGPADGVPTVFSGSLGTDLSMWEPQLALSSQLRMIRIDNRGHGRSPAPTGPYSVAEMGQDVIDLLDHLELEQVALVGLSIGGMIGLWLAANAPGRISRLVCMCSAAHAPNGDAFRQRAADVRAAGSVAGIAPAVVERWLTPGFAAAQPQLRDGLLQLLSACDPEGYASSAEAVGAFDLRAELSSISAPTLVVSGAQDAALPVALQEEIAAGIPGARHVVLDPGAHIVSVEQAEEVNRLIGEFLA